MNTLNPAEVDSLVNEITSVKKYRDMDLVKEPVHALPNTVCHSTFPLMSKAKRISSAPLLPVFPVI